MIDQHKRGRYFTTLNYMYVFLIYSLIHVSKHVALRPQKRDGLLGTGKVGVREKEWVVRPRAPTRKDRGSRGPPPEQQCWGSGDLAIAQQLAYNATAVSIGVRNSHKVTTSLLLISSGPANESLTSSWESNSPPSSWSRLDSTLIQDKHRCIYLHIFHKISSSRGLICWGNEHRTQIHN